MEAICKEVIITNILRRGNGTSESPIRIITQIFEKDGTLLAENDPEYHRPYLSAVLLKLEKHLTEYESGIDVSDRIRKDFAQEILDKLKQIKSETL